MALQESKMALSEYQLQQSKRTKQKGFQYDVVSQSFKTKITIKAKQQKTLLIQKNKNKRSNNNNKNWKVFDLNLVETEFHKILEIWNLLNVSSLQSTDLQNIFKPLIKAIYKKFASQFVYDYFSIEPLILNTFWEQQFEPKQVENNCQKWINKLSLKIKTGRYPMDLCLVSFNQTIASGISTNIRQIVKNSEKFYNSDTDNDTPIDTTDDISNDNSANMELQLQLKMLQNQLDETKTTNFKQKNTINKLMDYVSEVKERNKLLRKEKKKLESDMKLQETKCKEYKEESFELQKKVDLYEGKKHRLKVLQLDDLSELERKLHNGIRNIQLVRDTIIEIKYKCIICLENEKNISFDGCNHMAICQYCEQQLEPKICPICRKSYRNAKKINF